MSKHARTIGAAIKERRLEKGLTQWQVAEMVDCDYAYISMIERGARNPSLKIVEKIEEALDFRFDITASVFREPKDVRSLTPTEERWLGLIQNRDAEEVEAVGKLVKGLFQLLGEVKNPGRRESKS